VIIAVLELVRRPGRFASVGVALSLLVTLLVVLGGLLDGLVLRSTGAIDAQRADLVVFSADARSSVGRSRLTVQQRRTVEAVDGVEAVGGVGATLVAAAVPGADDLVDVAVLGFEIPPEGVTSVPGVGTALADRTLEEQGVSVGDELRLGSAGTPLRVTGWLSGTSYLGQGSLWVSPATWRKVQSANRPDQAVSAGVFQVLVVQSSGDVSEVAERIDRATRGETVTLTRDAAAEAIPGVTAQRQVMTGLIGVTVFVAGLVAALFFVLLLIERTALYATLKALGAPSRTLAAGILLQSVVVACAACVLGGLVALAVAQVLPASVIVDVRAARFGASTALVVVAAAGGALVSLRRIVRIDPASAIS
jgi:putative ABC transport system permease protein